MMADLAEVFVPLSDTQIDIYYDSLKNIEEYWLGKAIMILRDEHPFKRFPLPKEMRDAVKEAYDKSAEESLGSPEGCELCNYTGFKIEENRARPCSCSLGKSIAKGWNKHLPKKYKKSIRKED